MNSWSSGELPVDSASLVAGSGGLSGINIPVSQPTCQCFPPLEAMMVFVTGECDLCIQGPASFNCSRLENTDRGVYCVETPLIFY